MADPLRRTLLAKLRARKKGSSTGDSREAWNDRIHSSIKDVPSPRLLHPMTVSKKQSWLQQSSDRSTAEGLLSAEMETRHTNCVCIGQDGAVQPSLAQHMELDTLEEKVAGGEGEIWYNPIPEDEDGELMYAVTPSISEDEKKMSSRTTDLCLFPDVPALSPSSPILRKKGAGIHWSLPDRIRSPRTVRKLSIKMKKLPELSKKLSIRATGLELQGRENIPVATGSQTVLSRYHLDTTVSTRRAKKGSSKAADKGGYLSDGDSPEPVSKTGRRGSEWKMGNHGGNTGQVDVTAFVHYSFEDDPLCVQHISGLMSLHLYGAEDLKPPWPDSRDVYCAVQVDSLNKARTALLPVRSTFLDLDHTFHVQMDHARRLRLLVFGWEAGQRRHRLCCHGDVLLPVLFRGNGASRRLAVRLEPQGIMYVKLSLMERWGEADPRVFGAPIAQVVQREGGASTVPLIVERCVSEIERRGCQAVGLYRLCGSAAVKKELREAFERDGSSVRLSEDIYPDVNVITGVLKDYLRELPSSLISEELYKAVLSFMAARPLRIVPSGCENDREDGLNATKLLANLPQVEKETLRMLLDHLKKVASHHSVNKMTCQNLAVCFGPVLLSQRQEPTAFGSRVFADSEELASALHFKKHIEVLHYLLQLWPVTGQPSNSSPSPKEPQCLRRKRERPQALNLSDPEIFGILRSKPGRLDSPSNRYAGDWSSDYDCVPRDEACSTEDISPVSDPREQDFQKNRTETELDVETAILDDSNNHITLTQNVCRENNYQAYVKIHEINPIFSKKLNLSDLQQSIDILIGNLERELSKNKLNIGY